MKYYDYDDLDVSRDVLTDIEKLDALMSMVRDHVILALRKVADDLEKEELK